MKLLYDLNRYNTRGDGPYNATPLCFQINPQHSVPCIRDGELVLTESRAIMIYLIEKYAKKSHTYLYPSSDIVEKARIHQMLDFDLGSFYKAFMDNVVSTMVSS